MELIVISNPKAIANEGTIINSLFRMGLKCFHIRKPGSDRLTVRQLVEEIDPQYHANLSLHQFHEIAPSYGMKRLHYTERDRMNLTEPALHSKLNDGFILSTSIHDITLLQNLANFDYVFYGPVFNSISKKGYLGTLNNNFKLAKPSLKPNVIAVGGVELSAMQLLKKMGFDGVAVLGALWSQPHRAISQFNQLQKSMAKNNDEYND